MGAPITKVVGAWLAIVSSAATAHAADSSPSRSVVDPSVLIATLVGECAANDDALGLMKDEAARVWRRGGVNVRWVAPADVPFAASPANWVVVRCVDGRSAISASAETPVIPIAAIRFVGALPTNTILLDVANARTLMRRQAHDSRDPRGRFQAYVDVGLGRMLGRAVAHEIGHFLSQSGSHTPDGLMRATHTVAALTGASLGPFTVRNARVVWASSDPGDRPAS